jgi:hypothetical protein
MQYIPVAAKWTKWLDPQGQCGEDDAADMVGRRRTKSGKTRRVDGAFRL